MIAEFNWWLLIVGLVIGAALVWLVLADSRRRESEISAEELPKEATWIAETLRDSGRRIDPEMAEAVLRLHRTYLASLPHDDLTEDDWEVEPVDAAAPVDAAEPVSRDRRTAPERPSDQELGHSPPRLESGDRARVSGR